MDSKIFFPYAVSLILLIIIFFIFPPKSKVIGFLSFAFFFFFAWLLALADSGPNKLRGIAFDLIYFPFYFTYILCYILGRKSRKKP
jgi:hypothetical protein